MKKNIKFFVLIMIVVMVLSISTVAFAATPNSAVVSANNTQQSINYKDYFQKAQIAKYDSTGVSFSLTEHNPNSSKSTMTNVKIIPKDTAEAQQMMSWAQAQIAQDQNAQGSIVSPMSQNNYREKWDSTGQAKCYCTVYFTDYSSGGYSLRKMDSITGGVSAPGSGSSVGSGVTITSNSLYMGEWGKSVNPVTTVSQWQTVNISTSMRSWTVTPPSSWPALDLVSNGSMGGHYTVVLSRGGSSWSTTVDNDIPNY